MYSKLNNLKLNVLQQSKLKYWIVAFVVKKKTHSVNIRDLK